MGYVQSRQQSGASGRLGTLARQLRRPTWTTVQTTGTDAPSSPVEPGSYVWPTGGLFIDDYSSLPRPTTDMTAAKRDMDLYGYCILQDMLPPERLSRLLDKLVAQAKSDGVDPAGHGPTETPSYPILASMQNKGQEYVELLEDPKVLEIVEHVIGEHFHFQILNQAWHTGGKEAAPLHTDQWWFPPPARHDRPVRVPTGSISRPGAYEPTWHPEPPHGDFISPSGHLPCLSIKYPWSNFHGAMLFGAVLCDRGATLYCDIDGTGATRIMPGSHLSGRHPLVEEAVNSGQHLGSIPICGPAGSCALYDGRIWHQAGANLDCDTDQHTGSTWRLGIFNHYCAPFMRSQEAISLTTDRRNVVPNGSARLREMLGLSSWAGRGRVGSVLQLSGHETGLPKMSLAPDAAPQFQEIKTLLDLVDDCTQPVQEDAAIDTAVTTAVERRLPRPTCSICELEADLETYGYCIIDSALSSDALTRLTHRTMDQAAAEAAAGVSDEEETCAVNTSSPTFRQQQIWSLANKGEEFVSLMLHKIANQLVRHVLGEEFQLSSCKASIQHKEAGPSIPVPSNDVAAIQGSNLGFDQWWMPQPVNRAHITPKMRPGSVTIDRASAGEISSASKHVIAPAVTLDVVWPLSKFVASVCPGSHKSGRHPAQNSEADDIHGTEGVVTEIAANPGSCIVMDGRLWQSVTSTSTPSCCKSVGGHSKAAVCLLQYNYCGPQFRTVENHQLSICPDVLNTLPQPVKAVLGFRPWNSYGSEFGRGNDEIYTEVQRLAVDALLPDASSGGPSLAAQLLQAGDQD